MAVNQVTTFIPEIWSARLVANLDKALILAAPPFVNFNYEGQVNPGNTVHIQTPGSLTAADYVPGTTTISYAVPTASSQDLAIDKRKYVAFAIDDLDRVQSNVNLVDVYTQRAAYAIAGALDTSVAALYSGAGLTDITISLLSSPDAYVSFVTAGKQLDEANVPRAGRWAAISPAFYAQLLKDTKFTQASALGDRTVQTGQVGQIAGFDIYVSNNLTDSNSGTGITHKCLYGTADAITMARALVGSPEAMRLESSFATGIRMEYAWGLKVVQANALGTITVTVTADS
jgi:N4-gp56 family major capsid protein